MKGKITTFLVFLLLTAAGGFVYYQKINNRGFRDVAEQLTRHNLMKITSPAFPNNGVIPKTYTCDGDSVNPELNITKIPENTQSLALIVDDPDAPSGNFVHWLLFNIPPDTGAIAVDQIPNGAIVGMNSAAKNSYIGPCPPSGTHHYHFRLYALNKTLDLDQTTDKQELTAAMSGKVIDQTDLIGSYSRK